MKKRMQIGLTATVVAIVLLGSLGFVSLVHHYLLRELERQVLRHCKSMSLQIARTLDARGLAERAEPDQIAFLQGLCDDLELPNGGFLRVTTHDGRLAAAPGMETGASKPLGAARLSDVDEREFHSLQDLGPDEEFSGLFHAPDGEIHLIAIAPLAGVGLRVEVHQDSRRIETAVRRITNPLLLAGVLVTLVLGLITYLFSNRIIRRYEHRLEAANSTLEEQRRRLEAIFEHAPVGLLFVDPHGRIALVNREFLRNVGAPEEDLERLRDESIDQPYLERVRNVASHDLSDPGSCVEFAKQALESRQRVRSELTMASHEKVVFVGAPVNVDRQDCPARIILNQNVTRERELEQLRDDLMHMIVHDLKNPLTAISAAGDTLESLLPASEGARLGRSFDVIRRGVRAMLAMIMNLLDISRLEENKLQLKRAPTDVLALIEEMRPDLEAMARTRLLCLPGPAELPQAQIDAEVIRRVIENIFANSVKHTTPSGRIVIEVEASSGGSLEVTLSDDGEGIPKESHARIFDKFGQAKDRRRGSKTDTGLGLTFCKLAVEAHGGTIGLKDTGEQGATFYFRLPLEAAEEGLRPPESETSSGSNPV